MNFSGSKGPDFLSSITFKVTKLFLVLHYPSPPMNTNLLASKCTSLSDGFHTMKFDDYLNLMDSFKPEAVPKHPSSPIVKYKSTPAAKSLLRKRDQKNSKSTACSSSLVPTSAKDNTPALRR